MVATQETQSHYVGIKSILDKEGERVVFIHDGDLAIHVELEDPCKERGIGATCADLRIIDKTTFEVVYSVHARDDGELDKEKTSELFPNAHAAVNRAIRASKSVKATVTHPMDSV